MCNLTCGMVSSMIANEQAISWCSNCRTDVSLAHAIAELPCPACGMREYFYLVGDGERENLLNEAERRMRLGRWDDASLLYMKCQELELISAADMNLSLATVEWRKECAAAAEAVLRSMGDLVPLERVKAILKADFDGYVVSWVLGEYCRIGVDRRNNSCFVRE